jgi:hypothetical protein
MASNHGSLTRDIIGNRFYLNGYEIIDSSRNLKNIKTATVRYAHIKKDLEVDGQITTSKIVVKDPSRPTNVYLFGPSTVDTGALAYYYPNVISAMTSIPGTNLRHVVQPLVGGFPAAVVYNTENRHSDGIAATDYLVDGLGMTLANAFDITQLPSEDGFLINYAVSGATALGCTWNAYPNPTTFTNVAGVNGIVDQVDKFLTQRAAANKTIDPNDLFIFASQNINDIGIIATSMSPGAAIAASVTGVMTKLQQLYNLGARHIMFQVVGNGSLLLEVIPAFVRIDAAVPGTTTALSGVSDAITDAFVTALSAAVDVSGPMSECDLILTDTSTIASQILVDKGRFGLRSSLLSDPDPRVPGTINVTSSFVADSNILTITSTSGIVSKNMILVGGGVTVNNIKIVEQITGVAGNTGTYKVDHLQLAGVSPTSLVNTPSFPFPTLVEQALVPHPNRKLDRKVFFSDDFHFTQTGQLFHADYFLKFALPFQPINLL